MGLFINLAAIIASTAIALAVLSGTGYKYEWWQLGLAFKMLQWAFWGGVAASVMALIGVLFSKQKWVSACVLVAGFGLVSVIGMQVNQARSVPRMHDITTDMQNPPQFDKVLALRTEKENSLDYATKMVPATEEGGEPRPYPQVQKEAYPDIKPLALAMSVGPCFDLADETARAQGWEMVNEDKDAGLIEATDTSFWFGFKDDVAIRVRGDDDACRVDVRSASRVGLSDVGINAKRVRTYIAALKAAAE